MIWAAQVSPAQTAFLLITTLRGHGSVAVIENGTSDSSGEEWYVAPTDAYGVTLLNNPTRSQEKAMQAVNRAFRI